MYKTSIIKSIYAVKYVSEIWWSGAGQQGSVETKCNYRMVHTNTISNTAVDNHTCHAEKRHLKTLQAQNESGWTINKSGHMTAKTIDFRLHLIITAISMSNKVI